MSEENTLPFKGGNQAMLNDVDGRTPIFLDINFGGQERYKDTVMISIGDSERRIIRYSDLFSFMFVLGTPEQQAKMMPVRQELGNEYMKQVRIKCKKDMKEGEELVVNIRVNVPQVVEEQILKDIKTPYLLDDKK